MKFSKKVMQFKVIIYTVASATLKELRSNFQVDAILEPVNVEKGNFVF
jgi:hypothetical protein